jgi:hypothetical protein
VRGGAGELAPARPLVAEAFHRPLYGPRAGAVSDRFGHFVDGQFGGGEGIADGRDDLDKEEFTL